MPASNTAADTVTAFFAAYPLRTYGKGQILIHAGDDPQHIYYLVKGNIRQYDISYRGDEVIMTMFKPGAFLPMLWAVTQKPNTFFFAADTDIEVRVAPYQEVVAFLQQESTVMFDLLGRLYSGVDGLLHRMSHLMTGTASERLAYEIAIECRRFGAVQADGTYTISITEVELGARSGLARETVSRELQKLSQHGLISLARGSITVHDVDQLDPQSAAHTAPR